MISEWMVERLFSVDWIELRATSCKLQAQRCFYLAGVVGAFCHLARMGHWVSLVCYVHAI